MHYKQIFVDLLYDFFPDQDKSFLLSQIGKPPSPELGDFSFPCFQLSKSLKKSPNEISEQLAHFFSKNQIFSFTCLNGYLNATINPKHLFKTTLTKVFLEKNNYGCSKLDTNSYVIDTFNANPLKTLHIGHIRNIVTGDFVYKILKKVGANPIPVSYGGDIGTHVVRWFWYFSKLSDSEKVLPSENLSKWFGEIYLNSGYELEKNLVAYKQEINAFQEKIMQTPSLQQQIKNLSLKSHEANMQVGKELGVTIMNNFFESDAEKKFFEIRDSLFSKFPTIFKQSQNAIIADLEDAHLKNLIIQKQNGAALYAAKDIGLVCLKKQSYAFANNFLYVVASEQEFYFKQLFKLFSLIYPDTIHTHINHGLVNTLDGKMKSRAGESFLYEDFKHLLFEAVKQKLIENSLSTQQDVLEDISFGVIKFELLKTSLNKNLIFNISSALDFQGDSAPYLQYSGVRAKSILEKSNFSEVSISSLFLDYDFEQDEINLVSKIMDFEDVVILSYTGFKPQVIANYSIELAQLFNKFYSNCQVLVPNKNIKNTRLLIVRAFLYTLENSLDLLGIKIPKRM